MAIATPVTAQTPGASASPPATSGPLLAAWAAYKAGFRGQALITATAIAGAESSYHPDSVNNNPQTGDYSVGLWQINYFGNLLPGRTKQFGPPQALTGANNAVANANAAYAISGGGRNFSPWTTYTSGAYQSHAAEAAQAVDQVTGGNFQGPSQGGPTSATATLTSAQSGSGGCKPLISSPSILGFGGGALFNECQARALLGGLLLFAGAVTGAAGVLLLTASMLGKAPVRPRGPVGRVEGTVSGSGQRGARLAPRNDYDRTVDRTDEARARGREAAAEKGPFPEDDE